MKLGIIGLPQSGKTTIFNALTQGDRPTTTAGGRFEVHTAVVDVPDSRVGALSEMFNPKKTIYAKVTYADIAGLDGSASKGGISGQLLTELSQMDAFLHVVRVFENDQVAHMRGKLDPLRDINNLNSDLLINDLILVERKLEKLKDEGRKGGGREKGVIQRETALFERLYETLSDEQPLRTLTLNEEEEKAISGFGFLTRKKMLIVFNLSEAQAVPAIDTPGIKQVGLMGKLEMEIAQLDPEEAEMFLDEYGIEEPSLFRMITLSYEMLDLQSFFTVGEDEVRAWTIRKGTPAQQAAGVIHSDLQKGFIRADVIDYESLIACGGMTEARNQGKLRLEGKTYVVQDGDIMHVRFNV